jgi:type IV pilus assembly protein PilC
MPRYGYEARDASGRTVTGVVEARDERALIATLRPQGYTITAVREEKKAFDISSLFRFRGRVKTKDVTIFSRQFATMVNAGLPLMQALEILARETDSAPLRRLLDKVRADVGAGLPLSEALKQHPGTFSRLYTDLVKAGETGGALDIILQRLASYLEKSQSLKNKVRSALTYPAVVALVAFALTGAIIIFAVPFFANVYESFGAQLPVPTLILLGISRAITGYFWLVALVLAGLVLLIRQYAKSDNGRLNIDRMLLKMPVFGPLFRKAAVARFARTFAVLVASGVPILEALEVVARSAGNRVIETSVMKAREDIREGELISDPLQRSGVFPPMVTQMVLVGEETGSLEEMLTKIADFYDEEVDTAVGTLTTLIEPLMIVVLGAVVAGIVVALYLPIFRLATVIH